MRLVGLMRLMGLLGLLGLIRLMGTRGQGELETRRMIEGIYGMDGIVGDKGSWRQGEN